jgi:S1-C subfamily serine protease
VPFEVRDVSVDRAAADEMVRRTRQMGVPVIADRAEAIVGFDLPRLQKMAARHRPAGLGLRVKDADDGPGAYVGSVRPDSPGQRAGVQPGDVVEELSGIAVRGASDLERIGAQRRPGQPTSVTVRRGSEKKTLIIPG